MGRIIFAVIVVVISATCSSCSKRELFAKAMAYERGRAHLTVRIEDLSFGKIVYLSNDVTEKKESIVMLHGFAADKDTWVRFAKDLSDDYRLIIPDLPGHGESTQEFSLNYGIQEQAKRLKEFLGRLKAQRVHLVASSMGGAIALRYTHMYPGTVRSLTLIDSYGAIRTPSALDELIRVSGKNPVLQISNTDDYKAMMNYAMVDPPYIPGILIDVLAEERIKWQAIEQKMLKDMMVDADQTAILPDIGAPTLIIWGKQDKIINAENAEFLHEKISGSRKVLFDDVGHLPMLEKTKETVQYFRSFLKGMERTAPNNALNSDSQKQRFAPLLLAG